MKTISERSGVTVYVIHKGKRYVGSVSHMRGSGGAVQVDVSQAAEAARRSAAAKRGVVSNEEAAAADARGDALYFQQSRAGGYGYDKFTAALSGMVIDGHLMTDNCSTHRAPKPPKGRKSYPVDFKAPRGYHMQNYSWEGGYGVPIGEGEGYASCHRLAGLHYLKALGYTVVRAL